MEHERSGRAGYYTVIRRKGDDAVRDRERKMGGLGVLGGVRLVLGVLGVMQV